MHSRTSGLVLSLLFLVLSTACASETGGSSSDTIGADTAPSVPCDPSCDDGEPCTIDSCQGGLCVFVPSGNCMLLGCNSHQITDPSSLQDPGALDPDGVPVKLAVTVGPGQIADCTGMACEDDAPCCNSCNATLGLFVDEAPLDLSLEPSWGCATDDCMGNAACAPVMAGVSYWVWGHVYPSSEESSSPPLDVDGWCIQTTPEGLSGVYRGALEPWSGSDIQNIELTVAWDNGWQIALTGEPQEGDGGDHYWVYGDIQEQQVTNITVGEADVSFDFTYCEMWEGETGEPCAEDWQIKTVSAHLTSMESSLLGQVTAFGGTGWNPAEDGPAPEDRVPAGGAMAPPMPSPVEGALQLERVPPATVANQADSTSTP